MACGCNDTSIPLVNCNDGCDDCSPTNLVNLPDCPEGSEACEEIVYADCTAYKGPNLPALGILNNDRFISVLTKLHKVVNNLITPSVSVQTYTLTNTSSTTAYKVTYLGLGPIYTSTAGATSSGTTITVGSTTGLVAGMTCEVTAGTGAFASGTTVQSVTNSTTFTVSQAPSTALSGGLTVVKCTGTTHTIYNTSVVYGTPQSIKAFTGSPVEISGTGTIV
jgi:hypothetical protein